METDNRFNVLVLSGGSNRGIAILGALHHLHESGHLQTISTYVGVSVGSVIASLLSIGLTPMYLFKQMKLLDLFQDNTEITMHSMIDLFTKFGLYDPKSFIKTIQDIFIDQIDTDPTMKELYNLTGNRLIIVATNVNRMTPVYIDHESHPDMLCSTAIRMSISIPLIFIPVRYENEIYVDGGISNNFPICHLDSEPNRVLGICCNRVSTSVDIQDPVQFMIYTVQTSVAELTRVNIGKCSNRCTVIDIDVGDLSNKLDFIPPIPVINKLFAIGVRHAAAIEQR
jgi:predicted acylesterase/phospholipase RssA